MRLLAHYEIPLAGRRAVVVGRSPILGKPMAMMLLNADATVTICHSRTQDLPGIVAEADIIVGAVGRPEFIKGAWIREGAVVIDAGYHPGGVGDVELAAVIDALRRLHAGSRRRRSDDHHHAHRADREAAEQSLRNEAPAGCAGVSSGQIPHE